MLDQTPITPNGFQGSDVERINQAVRAAAGTGRKVVIPRVNETVDGPRDVWLLDSAILLPADSFLELDNCHLKLSDRCRDNFIRTANCGMGISDIRPLRGIHIRGTGNVLLEGADHPRATGDAGKKLGERTYGTDAGVAGQSQTGDWRNIGILLAFVEDFSIEGLAMKDTHCWAISLERCAHGTVRDIVFCATEFKIIDGTRQTILNQDGLDLRMGCHDITIENITGYSGDDLIALTAIPREGSIAGRTGSTMVSSATSRGEGLDDIHHIIISNVRGHCQGGHHIIRLLNTPGVRLHDVIIDGVLDTSPPGVQSRAAVKIGDTAYGGGAAPLGDTSSIIVNNVITCARWAVLVSGSLCDSVISNVLHRFSGAETIAIPAGPDFIRDVTIANIRTIGG